MSEEEAKETLLNIQNKTIEEVEKIYKSLKFSGLVIGIVYQYINMISSKIYNGETDRIKNRFNNFKDLSKKYAGNHINNARSKYPLSSWRLSIKEVHFGKTNYQLKKKLLEREAYWIESAKSYLPEIGYNISLGGKGPRTLYDTEFPENINSITIISERCSHECYKRGCYKVIARLDGNFDLEYYDTFSTAGKANEKLYRSYSRIFGWISGDLNSFIKEESSESLKNVLKRIDPKKVKYKTI